MRIHRIAATIAIFFAMRCVELALKLQTTLQVFAVILGGQIAVVLLTRLGASPNPGLGPAASVTVLMHWMTLMEVAPNIVQRVIGKVQQLENCTAMLQMRLRCLCGSNLTMFA